MHFNDENGASLAQFYGTATTVCGRIAGGTPLTSSVHLTVGSFDEFRVAIDTINNNTTFYINDSLFGTLSHGADHHSVQSGVGDSKFSDTTCDHSYTRAIKLNIDDVLTEPFDYPDGLLEASPGWRSDNSGDGSPPAIQVVDGLVRITGANVVADGDVEAVHKHLEKDCPAEEPYLYMARYQIRGSSGASRYWELHFTNNGGASVAEWWGTGSYIEANTDTGWVAQPLTTAVGEFDLVEVKTNPGNTEFMGIAAHTAKLYFNGALQGTWNLDTHTDGGYFIRYVKFVRTANDCGDPGTHKVEFDNLVVERCKYPELCNDPFADADDDDDVDQDDFALFQLCYTGQDQGPIPTDPAYCICFNRGADNPNDTDIDQFDFDAFEACASGPGIPADPNCDGPD